MRIKFKHLLILGTLIALLTVFLQIWSHNFANSQSEPRSHLQGKLLIWHPFERENAQIFNSFLNDFQRLNPDVQILSVSIPQSQLASQFIQQQTAGLGASMIVDFARSIPKMVIKQHIQPIDPKSIDLSAYLPSTLIQIRYRNQIYGIPLASHLRVLCYNQAKLNQPSLEEDNALTQPPTQLEELVARSRKGYSVGMVSAFEDTFWGMGSSGAKFFDQQGLVSPQIQGWEKWLEWLKRAQNEPNMVFLRNRNLLHQAFIQGKLTYYVCDSNEINHLKSKLKKNLKVAPLPRGLNQPATPLLYTGVMLFNRSASPAETQLALQVAKFITNPEQQIKGVVASQTFIPTHRQARFNQQFFPIESVLLKQSTTAVALPTDALEQIIPIFEQGEVLYQKAIAGEITPSEAVLKLTAVINQQISQNPKE